MPAPSRDRRAVSLAPVTRPALPRLLACLLAAVAVTVGTTAVSPAPSTADEPTGTRTPLRVSVDTLTPAVVPESGPVTLTGQITNRSKQTWTDLKAYLFTSVEPLRSRTELSQAAATSEDAPVGSRITSDGLYDEVGDLAPGATTSYRVSVPSRSLGIGDQPGVYWIGVHVLGAPEGGVRDTIADGRARTFIPMLPRRTTPTRLALVVPVRNEVRRGTAGRLLDFGAWQRSLSSDGRLDRLLNLSGRAAQPITWVVDPAVLDAARSVAQDNPKVDPGPDTAAGDRSGASGTPSPSPSSGTSGSPEPSDGASSGATSGDGEVGAAEAPSPQAVAARAWLDEFRRQAPTHTVTALPYGDLDVASVLDSRLRDLYQQATDLSTETMSGLGIESGTSVVAPVSGSLPGAALGRVDAGTPVLLRDQAYPDAAAPVVTRAGRAPVVLTDTAAGSGGPRPNARYSALALRQRVLSDAALHALSPEHDQPLVVSTPPFWDPGSAWNDADFFAGLDQPWLRMVDLPSVVSGADPGAAADPQGPVYPRADRRAQVPLANLLATQRLTRTGATYGSLLPANDTVEHVLSRMAVLGSSQNVRGEADAALSRVNSTTEFLRSQMQAVRIEGPRFVMMSSEQGPIPVTLINGLDQPVRVGVEVQTRSSGLKVSRVEPRTLGPGKRTAIRLQARSDDIGVHAVTLVATDADGNPIGSLTQFSVRTSRVSTVIWVIMAIGGILLFLAIAIRLFRRIRRRKSTHGPRLPRDSTTLPGQELNA